MPFASDEIKPVSEVGEGSYDSSWRDRWLFVQALLLGLLSHNVFHLQEDAGPEKAERTQFVSGTEANSSYDTEIEFLACSVTALHHLRLFLCFET